MTVVLKNVDEKFLTSVKAFSKAINAKCKVEKEKKLSKKECLEDTLKNFLEPQNYAVFERLKDK